MKKPLAFLFSAVLASSAVASDAAGGADRSGASMAPQGQFLRTDDSRLSERARKLIRIGEVAIARHDDAALDVYFVPDFVFHGPGTTANYQQLKAAFAAYRAAFKDFRVRREMIVESGDLVAARTVMSGRFTREFKTPFGPVAPTGKHVEWELNNLFRYDAAGRLVEEWVQYDTVGLMRKLGVELAPSRMAP